MARPEWVTYSDEEIEEMILKFNREGKSTSEIGIILRDQYGIPKVKDVTGERITQILRRKVIELGEELNRQIGSETV